MKLEPKIRRKGRTVKESQGNITRPYKKGSIDALTEGVRKYQNGFMINRCYGIGRVNFNGDTGGYLREVIESE